LDFNHYQDEARKHATYPQLGHNMVYPALGLSGESGEAADKVKKIWRNQDIMDAQYLEGEQKLALVKELGDVLWYVANLAAELKYPLGEVAQINLEKLQDRRNRGVIKSEGDNR
jgi:NTP pyrophosphatase (non-canonical NTP hydrolase)